jgi:hypothetical protein
MKRSPAIFALFVVAAISGCSKPFYHLKPQAEICIASTDWVVVVPQKELNADIESEQEKVAASGGGLVPALIAAMIDNDRAKKAEIRVQPLRNALVNYDFPARLAASIEMELVKYPWLHLRRAQIEREAAKGWMRQKYDQSDAGAILFVEAAYQMTPKFDNVQCTAKTVMFPKKKPLSDYAEKPGRTGGNPVEPVRAVYRNDHFEASSYVSGISSDLSKENPAELSRQAALVQQALDKVAQEMAQRIASDLAAR